MTAPYLTEEELAAQQAQQQPDYQAQPVENTTGTLPESQQQLTASTGSQSQAPGAAPSGAPTVSPPPPPPPSLADYTGQVTNYASDWMNNPNPYLSPLVSATRAESEGRLSDAEQEAKRGLAEWVAQRGLVGSSYEGEQQVDLQGQLQQARMEDERALQEALANYETLGRQAAGSMGLNTLGALEQQFEFGTTSGLSERELDLRAQEVLNQGRALDLQEARDIAATELGQAELAQQGEQFEANLEQRQAEFAETIGLSREQFEAETAQFQQTFNEQVASRLQQNEQFTMALESEEAQNALSVGLQGRALDLQEAGMQMEDAWNQAALDQERELATRAQDLQQQGLEQEDAYRYAALEQDADFRSEQLRLEELGLNMEDSYREAEQAIKMRALDIDQQQVDQRATEIRQQDRSLDLQEARDLAQLELSRDELQLRAEQIENQRWLEDRALQLQERGLDADIAFQQAQQDFEYGYTDPETGEEVSGYRDRALSEEQRQFNEELQFRMDQAETDKEKFDAMYELWEEYYGTGGPDEDGGNITVNINTGTGDTTSGDYDWGDSTQRPNFPEEPGNWEWDGTQWVDQDTGNIYVPDE